jgi:two-component system cell cycle sensor histidine kinase/response regulator CckA
MMGLDALDSIPDPLQVMKAFAVNAPVGIQIYNADGYSIYVNEKHTAFFGCPPPPQYCVLNDEIAESQGLLHLIRKAFSGTPAQLPMSWYDPRELTQIDDENIKKFGKRCAIETHMTPVFDKQSKVTHVIFIFKDVTAEMYMQQERAKALKERDDANSLLQSIIDNTQSLVYVKDLAGKFIFANKQYCRTFDKELSEVLGKTGYELFPQNIAEVFSSNDLKVQQSRSYFETEETAIHPDGKQYEYISSKFPLFDSEGVLYGIGGISTNVTARRKLERELNSAKRMESMGLLVGGIAHDFGNILGIVVLHSDLLLCLYRDKMPQIKPSLEIIKAQTLKASSLIRNLLAFGRKNQIETRVLSINSVIQQMQNILIGVMGDDILIEFEFEDPAWLVLADPIHIEQIMTNLCLNARDAMPKGGHLRIRTAHVTLNGEGNNWRIGKPRGEYVELAISDSGTGMSPEVLVQLFEPFYTTKEALRGTGLGLASVMGLVTSNGGDIQVESQPGAGSTFRLYFPRSNLSQIDLAIEPSCTTCTGIGKETILLVEDQVALRTSMAEILKQASYTVIEASNGIEALEILQRGEHSIGLIATDVIMPRLGGADLIRQMRKIPALNKIKVLFISGYSDERLSAHKLHLDTFNFIEKPFSAETLLDKIQRALRS